MEPILKNDGLKNIALYWGGVLFFLSLHAGFLGLWFRIMPTPPSVLHWPPPMAQPGTNVLWQATGSVTRTGVPDILLYLQRVDTSAHTSISRIHWYSFLQHVSHVQLIFDRLFHVFLHQIGPISKKCYHPLWQCFLACYKTSQTPKCPQSFKIAEPQASDYHPRKTFKKDGGFGYFL